MFSIFSSMTAHSASKIGNYNIGDVVTNFKAVNQNGAPFELAQNKGKKWTVLYFYPKADTPGCTKQACAFRDSIKIIENLNAHVYGVSTDSPKDLLAFKEKYQLSFELLSDADGKISENFGAKMPLLTISKRHTFILNPELKLMYADTNVDPVMDAKKVAQKLTELIKASN